MRASRTNAEEPDASVYLVGVDQVPPDPTLDDAAMGIFNVAIAWLTGRDPDVERVVRRFLGDVQARLGRGSFKQLVAITEGQLEWVDEHHDRTKGPYYAFLSRALWRGYRRLYDQYGPKALQREWVDQKLRDAAAADPKQVLPYLEHVARRLRKLKGLSPQQWHVPGHTFDEVVDATQLELLEVLRGGRFGERERPGQEASIAICAGLKNRLRRRRELYEAMPPEDLVPLREAAHSDALEPEPQMQLEERQRSAAIKRAFAEIRLSPIQRKWLAGMRADVEWHGELVLQRVADQLGGKHRASASRMRALLEKKLRRLLKDDL